MFAERQLPMGLTYFCRFCKEIYSLPFFFYMFSRILFYIPTSLGRGSILFYALQTRWFLSLQQRQACQPVTVKDSFLRSVLSWNIIHCICGCYTHLWIAFWELGVGKCLEKILNLPLLLLLWVINVFRLCPRNGSAVRIHGNDLFTCYLTIRIKSQLVLDTVLSLLKLPWHLKMMEVYLYELSQNAYNIQRYN